MYSEKRPTMENNLNSNSRKSMQTNQPLLAKEYLTINDVILKPRLGTLKSRSEAELNKFKGVTKRIFPFRRKTSSAPILKDLFERSYLVIKCNSQMFTNNGDFYLDFKGRW